jgi:3-methylcrotonyl-CoA carboxylase alpha subunit
MLAKVITFGGTREAALSRIVAALDGADIRGVVTNLAFLSALLSHPQVRANRIDTGFIERHLKELTTGGGQISHADLGAAVAAVLARDAAQHDRNSPWSQGGWMPGGERRRTFVFRDGEGREHNAVLSYGRDGMTFGYGSQQHAFAFRDNGHGAVDSFINGTKTRAIALWDERGLYLRTPSGRFELSLADPFGVDDDEHAGQDRIVAPLPGTVVALLAEEGAQLDKGAPVLTLEVMKMEQTLRAPFAGVLKRMKCKVGDIVQEGVELAEIEPS